MARIGNKTNNNIIPDAWGSFQITKGSFAKHDYTFYILHDKDNYSRMGNFL